MKLRIFILTVLLSLSTILLAQNDEPVFATDGTEWKDLFERDKYEDSINHEVRYFLSSMTIDKKIRYSLKDSLNSILYDYNDLIIRVRETNTLMRYSFVNDEPSAEFRKYYDELGIVTGKFEASNYEVFCMEDLMKLFNSLVSDRDKLTKEIIKAESNSKSKNVNKKFVNLYKDLFKSFNKKNLPLIKALEDKKIKVTP